MQSVYDVLVSSIQNKEVNVKSPLSIVVKGMEIINSHQHLNRNEVNALLKKTLQRIAAGKDHIAGTKDDLIPIHVIDEIQRIIDSGMIDDFVMVVKDVANGKYNIQDMVTVATKYVPFCLKMCFKGSR